MDRVRLCLAVLMLFAAPACANSVAQERVEGRLIDLRGDLAADVAVAAGWTNPHAADIAACRWDDVPGATLIGTIRAGVLILSRNNATAEPSAKILRTTDGAVLQDAAGIGLGTSTGLDITGLVGLSEILEMEVRFFGVNAWKASRVATDPDPLQFSGFGVTLPGQSEQIDYSSRLCNIEVNARPRVVGGIPLILGFRSLQLHERFDVWRLDPQDGTPGLDAHTHNFLYGAQVGVEPSFFGGESALTLEGLAKAGVYANCSSQSASSPLLGEGAEAKRNRTVFVGELGLIVDYRFSQSFALRAGYELLWISGVALAPNQSPTTDLGVPLATLNASGSALYQGVMASLEFMF